MDFFALVLKALLALALGGLIGIDRQKNKQGFPAGIRTLAFISLMGFLSVFLSVELNNPNFLIACFSLIFLFVIVGYGVSFKTERFFGFTSSIIIFLAFMIGAISHNNYYYAVSLSIIISLLLNQKTFIHGVVSKIKDNEVFDALKFGIVAFIILPILPNTEIDPLGVINPFNLWLLVVLILSISYAGYILSKFLGKKKGLYASGLIGGLISSTAVASSLSIISKKNESLSDACATGITLATSLMFLRVIAWALIINVDFAKIIATPMILCFFAGIIASYASIKLSKKKDLCGAELVSESPFNFLPAVKFAALIAIILLISRLALMLFGDSGLYAASLFGGAGDIDAITISISTLSKESLIPISTAFTALFILIISNNLFKLFLVNRAGSKKAFINSLINYAIMNAPLIIWFTMFMK
ncbi:MAG: MgtC/SapB family protein [Candidatus Nanoarchaeia archaeon]|nr:MgtC/SapB family protein [Candidatus Nanoarchaeia archaeon]